jgi:hypothetical protein
MKFTNLYNAETRCWLRLPSNRLAYIQLFLVVTLINLRYLDALTFGRNPTSPFWSPTSSLVSFEVALWWWEPKPDCRLPQKSSMVLDENHAILLGLCTLWSDADSCISSHKPNLRSKVGLVFHQLETYGLTSTGRKRERGLYLAGSPDNQEKLSDKSMLGNTVGWAKASPSRCYLLSSNQRLGLLTCFQPAPFRRVS